MSVPMLQRRVVWVCPNGCPTFDVTERADVHQQLHPCSSMGGLTVPLVEQGTRVKVSIHEREDYLGNEVVTTDDAGRTQSFAWYNRLASTWAGDANGGAWAPRRRAGSPASISTAIARSLARAMVMPPLRDYDPSASPPHEATPRSA